MVEGDNRRIPEAEIGQTFQGPSLAEEMRNTLDPRLMVDNFVTAPPCRPIDIFRDLPAVGMTLAGSLGLLQGIVSLHERFNIPNPEGIRLGEALAWMVATLVIMGVAHHINRKYLPAPFRH